MVISLNRVIVAGNLVRDPELKTTSSNRKFVTMTIASNDYWRNKDGEFSKKTSYIGLVAWNRLAENCAKYLSKGKCIMVEGKLESDKFTDKNGQVHYYTRVICSSVVFLENTNKSTLEGSNENGDVDYVEEPAPQVPTKSYKQRKSSKKIASEDFEAPAVM